jgi:hypothetical protein
MLERCRCELSVESYKGVSADRGFVQKTQRAAKPGQTSCLICPQLFRRDYVEIWGFAHRRMPDTSQIKEHMDVISSDRKTVGKVDHLEGADKIKLTKQSSPDGEHHHFIPTSWVDHVDQRVHFNKYGADVTAHWQHCQR